MGAEPIMTNERYTHGPLAGLLLALVVWAVLIALGFAIFGCHFGPPAAAGPGAHGPPTAAAGTEPIIVALNLVAWAGVLLSAAAFVAGAWLPIPKGSGATLLAVAIGAWAVKILLVKFWWLIILLVAGLVAALIWHAWSTTALHVQGKRGWLIWWLERRTGRDLNQNGTVGEPKP